MVQDMKKAHDEPPPKATLDKVQVIATIFSLIAVPLIVAFLGFKFQQSAKESEARTKSLELAIQILKEPSSGSTQPGLREWAVETLQASSNVSMSEVAKRELLAKPLLPIQPGQRNFSTGGFTPVQLKSVENFSFAKIGDHELFLLDTGNDYAVYDVDGRPVKVFMNESVLLDPGGCVLHLMGFEHELSHAEQATLLKQMDQMAENTKRKYGDMLEDPQVKALEDKARKDGPINSTFIAFVCP
jgi:hypothetical protein